MEQSRLAPALRDELRHVLGVVDGFLGQMTVAHDMDHVELHETERLIDAIRYRYKQLQTLVRHKVEKDLNDKNMRNDCVISHED